MNNLKSIYKFEFIILLLILLIFFIQDFLFKSLLSIIGFGILLFIATLIYKKKKDTNFFRASAFRIVFSVMVFYFLIILLSGLLLGFGKTLFSPRPSTWMKGLVPTLIIILIIERLRFILVKNNTTDKLGIIILTIEVMLGYIAINTSIFSLNNGYKIFVFLCTTVMSAVARELLSNYMVMNYRVFTYNLVQTYNELIPIHISNFHKFGRLPI